MTESATPATTSRSGMGGGVNQRAQIKMSQDEIDEFLKGRHSMSMATVGADGDL